MRTEGARTCGCVESGVSIEGTMLGVHVSVSVLTDVTSRLVGVVSLVRVQCVNHDLWARGQMLLCCDVMRCDVMNKGATNHGPFSRIPV